ncbi:hypothetical protein CB1_000743035 [Camelus ferus]|nr:hypothetical protein CB1_000743035 [Camelus ferus]
MALNMQIRAACLLLLLLASLTSGSVLPHQTRQLADLQTQDAAGVAAGLTVCPGPVALTFVSPVPSCRRYKDSICLLSVITCLGWLTDSFKWDQKTFPTQGDGAVAHSLYKMIFLTALPLFWIMISASRGGHWGAWMPSSISAFEGTCVSIPCRFDFPDELRPAVVHGVWYFNSPYPKNYPPVVFKSRTQVVHESFQGRSRLLGDLGLRNCTLLLSNLSPELGGKYYFRGDLGGYNQYTFSEHSVLDIINTPNIVVPPEVVAGTEVEVSCMVPDNCPELHPELSWLGHDGLGEPTVLGRLREDEGTWVQVSLLHFVPTREANGHRLGCQASFPNTTLQFEGYASLDVKRPSDLGCVPAATDPPVIVDVNSSVEAIEGSHVSLLCGADSNPPPLLTWMRDGTVLREAVAESLSLELEEVTPAEDGVYACLAENAYGQDNRTVGLSVMYAPWKPTVNGTVVAVEGETVSILCSTQSNPDPILTIFKEKQILATVIYENELQLELPAVTPEDDGEYWCVAENQYGQRATAFNLSVEFAPVILLESHCAAARDTSGPEPTVAFELPSRNVTVNETEREFVYSERSGLLLTSILTLRGQAQAPPRVICTSSNLYGTKSLELPFQGAHRLMWAKIGPVGAVVAFAILIAIVCYITQTRRKKNVTESPSFSAGDNPPVLFSSDFRISGAPEKYESERRLGSERRLLGLRGEPSELDLSYSHSDLGKRPTKDSYTLTEELAEYAEIRVKIPGKENILNHLTLYHNPYYNTTTKDFEGAVLYSNQKAEEFPPYQERVQFLGNEKGNCTLYINPVKVSDSGQLGLRIMTVGPEKWMESIGLNVSEKAPPPHIQLPPEIQELQEVTVTCSLNFACFGYQIHLQWSLEEPAVNATTLAPKTPPTTHITLTTKTISSQSNLMFQPQWTHHGKNLTCQLWDPTKQHILSEKTVQLDVKHLPKLKIQVLPQEATVMEGASVTMECQVISSNPQYWRISWLKNGNLLPGTKNVLSLPEVTRDMSGKYQCEALNVLGTGKSEGVDLQVLHPPKEVTTVIQNPVPIREGDSVTLLCTYNSSNPRVTRYEWDTVGSRVLPAGLTIQNVAWDTGPVKCAACNQWCFWSPPVNLDVQYAPKDVRVLISPRTEIYSGHRVLLQCDFSSSHPADIHFFWKKNGVFLEEGKDLSFDSISPEDAGSYNCLVNNSIGQTESKAWAVQVLYAPRRLHVSVSPKDGVIEGGEAVLTCESDANPPISHYAWFDWNNQDLHHYNQMLRLNPVKVQQSGAYWCQGTNRLGRSQSPPSTLTVYYSAATISRRAALGVGFCLAVFLLAIWGVKLQRSWKRIQSQQRLQENSSGQSFFVRNIKARRTPQAEGPHSLGCYNPVMEDAVSYAALRFPPGETDSPRLGDAGTSEMQGLSPNRDDTVTYSVVQKSQLGDYENVTPSVLEDEGIHYSELVHFGAGERPLAQEGVEYVILKH